MIFYQYPCYTASCISDELDIMYLLEDGYNIRTVQELLGSKDVLTTMIYTHVLNRGSRGVLSPTDRPK